MNMIPRIWHQKGLIVSMSVTRMSIRILVVVACAVSVSPGLGCAEDVAQFIPTLQLNNPESRDQDDMCVWVHPGNPSQSMVITSDKSANQIFVYNLEGQLLQTIPVTKPGNIDIRQGVKIDGSIVDIVVVNQRANGFKLVIFVVDPKSRKLERIDDNCATGPNYGGCLYHSVKNGRLYFFCTSDAGTVEQYELLGNGQRKVKAINVRTLSLGKCEGAVADDPTGTLYVSEETKGVWKFGAEPDAALMGTLVAAVGEHGLKGDVEGLAIYKGADGGGYVLVSDQGRNRYMAYRREAPHQYVGEFAIEGASQTDGIELCQANLGPKFPAGFFACHTDKNPRPILVTPWPQIAALLSSGPATKSQKE